jgi:hypothetical protein
MVVLLCRLEAFSVSKVPITSLSLRINIIIRDSYAAKALTPYGLPPIIFIYIFGIVNSANIALVSRNIIYIVVLIFIRMIFVKSSKSLKSSSLFLSL